MLYYKMNDLHAVLNRPKALDLMLYVVGVAKSSPAKKEVVISIRLPHYIVIKITLEFS